MTKARKTGAPTKARPTKTNRSKVRTRRQERTEIFILEYLKDFNGSRAAIAAGYSPHSARFQAHELLHEQEVQERITKALVERSKRTEITADAVLKQHAAIANADPRELCELHRGCCRYCWGTNNRYQRTPREMEEARASHELYRQEMLAKGLQVAEFSEAGGLGWNPKRNPNPDCPECFGDGELREVWKDTRDLSPEARLLYAGIEKTQNGLKIRMRNQDEHLKSLGQHLGLYKTKVEHTGPNGAELGVVVVPAKRKVHDTAPTASSEAPVNEAALASREEPAEQPTPARKKTRPVTAVDDG